MVSYWMIWCVQLLKNVDKPAILAPIFCLNLAKTDGFRYHNAHL
jgi:hypothetical protein